MIILGWTAIVLDVLTVMLFSAAIRKLRSKESIGLASWVIVLLVVNVLAMAWTVAGPGFGV